MQRSTVQNLQAIAPKLLSGETKGDDPFMPRVVRTAIAILSILKDREWHTAADVAAQLDIGAKYARDILQACASSWELESHRKNGFRLLHDVCPVCSSIYYPDEDGYHECDRCGWHYVGGDL